MNERLINLGQWGRVVVVMERGFFAIEFQVFRGSHVAVASMVLGDGAQPVFSWHRD